MPNIYELYENTENKVTISKDLQDSIKIGNDETIKKICELINEHYSKTGKPCRIAFDGNYGVDWN